MSGYLRVPNPGEGLRLHLNENTAGCSPRVLEALGRLANTDLSFYPDYAAAARATAAYLGAPESRLLLLNGLDEGLHLASFALLRDLAGAPAEALVVEPAFDMYAACASAAGGRVVTVPPRADFTFPADETLAALTDRTRLVFLTNPNNPTGQRIERRDIGRIADAAPRALVLVDEAYVEFSGETMIDDGGLDRHPNVAVGRTFAKAHGLAALRIGALVAREETLAPIRRLAPPYNLNVCAAAALVAALEDDEWLRWYCAQVDRSKALLYAACDRLDLAYWPSAANFVLIRVGDRAAGLVAGLARRRIFIRDRTDEPGCAGCVRITTGVVEHTEACISAMEVLLCGEA